MKRCGTPCTTVLSDAASVETGVWNHVVAVYDLGGGGGGGAPIGTLRVEPRVSAIVHEIEFAALQQLDDFEEIRRLDTGLGAKPEFVGRADP